MLGVTADDEAANLKDDDDTEERMVLAVEQVLMNDLLFVDEKKLQLELGLILCSRIRSEKEKIREFL